VGRAELPVCQRLHPDKNDWLALLNITPQTVQPWPQQPTTHIAPDWDKELANARELNKKRQQSAATLWMDKTIYEEDGKPQQWDDTPVVPAQIAAFSKTVQLLKERHVQVIAIVDPVNPRHLQYRYLPPG
jgi:D-alanine transfer protein